MNFLKYSAIIPSLIAACLTLYSLLVFKQESSWSLIIINFAGTFIGHNAIAQFSLFSKGVQSRRMQWQISNRWILVSLSTVLLIPIIIYSKNLNTQQILNYSLLGFIILLYEKSICQFNLRSISFLKPLVVSYLWVMTCVGSVYFTAKGLNIIVLLEAFCTLIPLCLFYDIRDHDYDKDQNLDTLVHKFGLERILSASIRVYIISLLIRMTFLDFSSLWYLYVIEIFLFLKLSKTIKPEKSDLKYLILVDSFIIFKLLFVLVASI